MPKHESQLGDNLNKSRLSNEQLLGLWVEEQLSESQQHEFEQRCLQDEGFAKQVETYNIFAVQSEHYHSNEVPNWNRESTFDMPQKAKWWQWQGLPTLSFATSMLAIVMVLTGLQVRMEDGAMTISFSDKQSTQEIDRLVDERLAEFQQVQQLALTEYTQAMSKQQMDTSTQLTQYLLGASRKERREDFAELIKYVNEQRGDDQLFYARQLNKLQQDIYAKPDQIGTINE
ncbi:hypothetical protein [Paraglaciecola arctica]|uniref:Uncharacterized protein n=1 Tax=Paraglaciecola arctica BSs20135 TaxID=493475 RepID=K6XC32_9ALTE|nr:hypothetical protein [Paraglaciecola arctica]GAC18194.1 hypothetical protein GARC_1214 [Paraglaciecola arctica BSs20135]